MITLTLFPSMHRWVIQAIAAATVLGFRTIADGSGPDEAAWVRQRVQELQPSAEERRLDQIGWAGGLRDALQLAREHSRPVFLFTHDGRMAIGRC
jgi:hypothetical protein